MFTTLFDWATNCLGEMYTSCTGWFMALLNSIGAWKVVFALFMFVVLAGLLIVQVRGQGIHIGSMGANWRGFDGTIYGGSAGRNYNNTGLPSGSSDDAIKR